MNDLTLIIPAKNEQDLLPSVLSELKNLNCKITVSLKKMILKLLKQLRMKKLIYSIKVEKVMETLREAINQCETKYFCIFNADGSFDYKDLTKMYNLVLNNDFVFTSRYMFKGGSDDDTFVTFIGNKFFSKLGNILFSLRINDILYTFLMGKTESFKKLNIISDDFKFCVELPIKMEISKMKYTSIPSFEKKKNCRSKKSKCNY